MKKLTLLLASSAAALTFGAAARAADAELTVFDWAGWEIPDLIQGYTEKHGQMPTYAFFADDDEAFQKVSSGFKADIGHPCSQMISKYREADLIEPWDVSRIPEYANIAPRMKDSKIFADEAGAWFIPTDYAYTAIAYNTTDVPAEDVATLNVFKDPKYAGRISLPDNTDDVWSLALLATGQINALGAGVGVQGFGNLISPKGDGGAVQRQVNLHFRPPRIAVTFASSTRPTSLPSTKAAGAQAHRPRQNTGSSVTRPSRVVSCHSMPSSFWACSATRSAPIALQASARHSFSTWAPAGASRKSW